MSDLFGRIGDLSRAARSEGRGVSGEPRDPRWFSAAAVIALVLAVGLSGGCKKNEAQGGMGKAGAPPVPVSIAQVQQRDVPVQIRAIGTVEPYRTVSIRSQVQGELTEIGFKEGQYVNEGDILFKIDARSYEVALRLAEATLAKDIALAKDAESEAAWMKGLFSSNAAAERESEKARALADAAQAQVDADKAAVDNARLDVQWCTIRAPFEGYTGSLMMYPGAILKSRETDLVVLNQVKPIYVTFSVPENQLGSIEASAATSALAVEASFPSGSDPAIRGTLAFLDNQADRTTGMIRLRGVFANEDRRLWPGQFVNVALTVANEAGAILVPTQAIQVGQTGQFVFVVKADQTVEQRPVKSRREVDGWTVVEGGLEANQEVVTDGQLRLVPGSRIQPKSVPAPTSQSTTTKAAS